jgi:DNA-binding transcriptional ArsR family regulator
MRDDDALYTAGTSKKLLRVFGGTMTDSDDVSVLFRALAHPYRRVVLYYLDEHGEASLTTLVDCVTGWIQSGPGSSAAAVDHEAVRLQLHHVHLPTLAETGLVTYDREGDSVAFEGVSSTTAELLGDALRADVDGGVVRPQPATAEQSGGTDGEDEDA